jgi:hypothetical protein
MNIVVDGSSGIGEKARIFVGTFTVVQWFTMQVRHSGGIETPNDTEQKCPTH